MKKVLLFLASGFEVLEASAFIDIIGWNHLEGDGTTRLYTCGLQREVVSAFGQRVIVDFLIGETDSATFDALAIPGGFEEYGYYKEVYDERFLQMIREFHHRNRIIASVCVAALPVAKSGILVNKEGTTYRSEKRRDCLKHFGVQVTDNPIVRVGNVITSHGPSTAVEVALMLLEWLTTKQNTNHVARLMGFKK